MVVVGFGVSREHLVERAPVDEPGVGLGLAEHRDEAARDNLLGTQTGRRPADERSASVPAGVGCSGDRR